MVFTINVDGYLIRFPWICARSSYKSEREIHCAGRNDEEAPEARNQNHYPVVLITSSCSRNVAQVAFSSSPGRSYVLVASSEDTGLVIRYASLY